MGYLSNEEFFSRLVELFNTQKGKQHGAIYLSQRRLSQDEKDHTGLDTATSNTSRPLIIRASNGKSRKLRRDKVRLSTKVEPDTLESFYATYAETCKAGMTYLKPRDKSKKKAKAKKKKAATAAAAT